MPSPSYPMTSASTTTADTDHHRAQHGRKHLHAPDRPHRHPGAHREFRAAGEARIGPIDRIFTRVGAADRSVRRGHLQWVEMTETATFSKRHGLEPGPRTRGARTSTFDGPVAGMGGGADIARSPRVHALCDALFELTSLPGSSPTAPMCTWTRRARRRTHLAYAVKERPRQPELRTAGAAWPAFRRGSSRNARHYLAARKRASTVQPIIPGRIAAHGPEPAAAPVEEDRFDCASRGGS